jgi:hypothetical protein
VVGQNLRRALDFLPLARRLVTVRCDLDLPLAPTDLKPRPAIANADRDFSHYEMRSWLKEVQGDRGRQSRRAAERRAGHRAEPQPTCWPTARTARPTKRSSTGRPSSAGWRRSSTVR